MKKLLLLLCLLPLTMRGANPTYTSFDPTVFGSNNLSLSLTNGFRATNENHVGTAKFNNGTIQDVNTVEALEYAMDNGAGAILMGDGNGGFDFGFGASLGVLDANGNLYVAGQITTSLLAVTNTGDNSVGYIGAQGGGTLLLNTPLVKAGTALEVDGTSYFSGNVTNAGTAYFVPSGPYFISDGGSGDFAISGPGGNFLDLNADGSFAMGPLGTFGTAPDGAITLIGGSSEFNADNSFSLGNAIAADSAGNVKFGQELQNHGGSFIVDSSGTNKAVSYFATGTPGFRGSIASSGFTNTGGFASTNGSSSLSMPDGTTVRFGGFLESTLNHIILQDGNGIKTANAGNDISVTSGATFIGNGAGITNAVLALQAGTTNVTLVATALTFFWQTPFPDDRYNVTLTGEGVNIPVYNVSSRTGASFTTSALTFTGTIEVTGVRRTQP